MIDIHLVCISCSSIPPTQAGSCWCVWGTRKISPIHRYHNIAVENWCNMRSQVSEVLRLTESISLYFCFEILEDSRLGAWGCRDHSKDHKYMRNIILHFCCQFDIYFSISSLKYRTYLLTKYPRQFIKPGQWPCVFSSCVFPVWNELLLPGQKGILSLLLTAPSP